jgi:hypothetical protein
MVSCLGANFDPFPFRPLVPCLPLVRRALGGIFRVGFTLSMGDNSVIGNAGVGKLAGACRNPSVDSIGNRSDIQQFAGNIQAMPLHLLPNSAIE